MRPHSSIRPCSDPSPLSCLTIQDSVRQQVYSQGREVVVPKQRSRHGTIWGHQVLVTRVVATRTPTPHRLVVKRLTRNLLRTFHHRDTSMVTDMHELFRSKKMTNEDLSQWNVGRVTDMECMCKWATAGVCGCWRGLVCACCADPLAPPPPSPQSLAPPRSAKNRSGTMSG